MSRGISIPQRETLRAVTVSHRAGIWHRAEHSGQRVTLAYLARVGVLERRVWRGRQNEADAAHEYQLGRELCEAYGLQLLE